MFCINKFRGFRPCGRGQKYTFYLLPPASCLLPSASLPNRSIDTGDIKNYEEFFASQRVRRIYLDELPEMSALPVGIATMKLIVEEEDRRTIEVASQLIERIGQESYTEEQQQRLLRLLETILIYKFPEMSRREIESMFGLSELKQTKVYQEAKQEGREERDQEIMSKMIPKFLSLNWTVEQISQFLELDVKQVHQFLERSRKKQDTATD